MPDAAPVTSPSPPVSGLHLSVLIGASMLYVGVSLPFFPVFLAGQGLSNREIAIVLTIPMLTRLASNPVVTAIADRRNAPAETLALCAILAMALSAGLVFANGFWALALLVCALALAQGPMMPLSDALTLAEVRRRARAGEKPLDYGRTRVWGSATVFVAMLLGGSVVGLMPTSGIAWLMAVAAMAPVLPAMALARRRTGREPARAMAAKSAAPKRFWTIALLIASAGAVQASHAVYYSFASLHWQAIGLSPAFTGAAWALGVGSEIIFFIVAGRWLGGDSRAHLFLFAGAIGCVLRWLAMMADPTPAVLLGLQTMHALTFASTHLGAVYLLSGLAGSGYRAQAQGWLSASVSLGLALATLAAGQFRAEWGEGIYGLMALLGAIGGLGFIVVARTSVPNR